MIVIALVYAALLGLTLVGLGWPLVVKLDRAGAVTGPERGVCAGLFGAVIMYFGVFAVGVWRLDTMSMGALGLVLGACALAGLRMMPWRDATAWLRAVTADLAGSRIEAGLALVLIATLAVALVQGGAPPNDYDSLMYHLAGPKLDLEKGVIGPGWERALPNLFFPALTGHLFRFVMATGGTMPVQMVTALFGIAGTVGTAALGARLGLGRAGCLLAALAFAACRFVVWEMATAEVEVALTAYCVAASIAFLAWQRDGRTGTVVIAGLLLGGALLVKFHGGVFAVAIGLPMALVALRRRGGLAVLSVAALSGAALFVPHMAWTAWHTGNPLYPMLNNVFTPGGVDYFAVMHGFYGIGRDFLSVLVTPVVFSVAPMRYFDGMVLGAPYLVALAPLAGLARPRLRPIGALLFASGLYYVVWFFSMSQQVRFLAPILPFVSVFAAAGAIGLLQSGAGMLRAAAVALLALLALNQGLFVGIYAALRLPPALGLVGARAFHEKTPTMTGAVYVNCTWLSEHLQPGERVLSVLTPHSYYCPQAAAITRVFPQEVRLWVPTGEAPDLPREDFVKYYAANNVRWVIVPTAYENRRNDSAVPIRKPVDLTATRLGIHLAPVLAALDPVATDAFTAIYDGRQILHKLGAP